MKVASEHDLTVGTKIINALRRETICEIKIENGLKVYYTTTKRGSLNKFTQKDLCEASQGTKEPRILIDDGKPLNIGL